MPLIKHFSNLGLTRSLSAFLRFEAGVTRGQAQDYESQLRHLRKRLNDKDREVANLRKRLTDSGSGRVNGIKPENIVWIFGTARTGSTWLGSIMKSLPDHALWNEPWLGEIFGSLPYRTPSWEYKRRRRDFILSHHYEKTNLRAIRNFSLEAINARFFEKSKSRYVVVKEPHGSMGAPTLMKAFPESRMIFLVRDPRDVSASGIAAHLKGGWAAKNKDDQRDRAFVSADSVSAAKMRARMYRRDVSATKEAFEVHKGRKVLVRYEDLKSNTLETMNSIYSSLEIPTDREVLARVVDQFSWTNLPDTEKGSSKARRKAAPGSWSEDLSKEQIRVIEEITGSLLEKYYPGTRHVT